MAPVEAHEGHRNAEAGARVRSEMADVFIYLTRLADVLDVDLLQAADAKLDESGRRYDAETYRGTTRKAPPLT
jgi:NTP pyrophosphatase (non-canonical NTP hydrolase)